MEFRRVLFRSAGGSSGAGHRHGIGSARQRRYARPCLAGPCSAAGARRTACGGDGEAHRLPEPERKAVRSALVRIVAAAVLIWVLGFALWVLLLPERGDDGIRTDGIVVMTGGPGRVDRGVDLLRAGRAKRLDRKSTRLHSSH